MSGQRPRRLDIRTKLSLFILTVVALFAVILYGLVIPLVEQEKRSERQGTLRAVVASATSVMQYYEDAIRTYRWKTDPSLPRTRLEAQKRVLAHLRQLRYRENEHLFVLDGSVRMLMHPLKPELEGKNMARVMAPDESFPFEQMAIQAQQHEGVFVNYIWLSKWSQSVYEPQTTYAEYFYPWNWVVCSSLYTQDIDDAVHELIVRTTFYVAGGLLVGWGILYVIGLQFINPLLLLARQVRDAADHTGESAAGIISVCGDDEIGTLADAFRHTLNRRHQAMTRLKDNEENLRTTLNSIGDAVIATDIRGNITRMNPVAAQLTGWIIEDARGKPLSEIFHTVNALTKEAADNPVAQVLKAGETVLLANHTLLMAKDGSEYQIADSAAPIRDNEGRITGVVLVFRDVTEEYAVRIALQESEQRQRDLLNNTSSVIYIKDLEGRYLFINRMFEELFHFSDQSCRGKTDYSLFSPELAAVFRANDSRAIEADMPQEFEETVPQDDEQEHHYLSVKFPLKNAAGEIYAVCGISTDITERKRAEEELKKAQSYIANIIDSMPSVLIGVDCDGKVTQWNSEAARVTGTSAKDVLGQPLTQAFPRLSSEIQRVRTAILMRQKQIDPKRPHRQDGEIRYEDVTIYPLIANGVEGAVIRVDDVTERVRIEEMMVQSEKMLSVGGLAAGMAHEINNPLAGMMQTAVVLSMRLAGDLPDNERAAAEAGTTMAAVRAFMEARGIPTMLGRIHQSGDRAAKIVLNMLNFARKSSDAVSSHNLAELLDRSVDLAGSDYDLKRKYDFRRIGISREYEEDLPPLRCDAGTIQQVILNVLRNGAEAMQEDSGAGDKKPHFILRVANEAAASMLRIEIEDNGPGMDEETCKRIFEPFYTTKPVGFGTGLGLSVSYFIVTENHGGAMSVESRPGRGTRFIIRLPVGDVPTGSGRKKSLSGTAR